MGDERTGRRTTVQGLEHGGLHLEEPPGLEGGAQRADHPDPRHGVPSGGVPHDEVGVALADPGVLAQVLVGHRQRAERLGREHPRVGHDGQLAALGPHHAAGHRDVVAEVDVLLPRLKPLLADVGEREHGLQLRGERVGPAVGRGGRQVGSRVHAVLEPDKAELARVADEQHPAGHRDLDVGLLPRLQRGEAGVRGDLREPVGARDLDRVRLHPGVEEALPLVAADAQLLGGVVGGLVGCGPGRGGSRVGHGCRG